MENEKEAVKRAMAHEAGFRDEKQRIVESMGGSRAELITPSADTRVQRKLRGNPSRATASSLISSHRYARPEQAVEDLPGAFNDEHNDRTPVQLAGDSASTIAAAARPEDTALYDGVETNGEAEPVEALRRRGPKFKKNTCYIAAAAVFAVALGGIAGVVVALLNGAADSKSSSQTASEGTNTIVDDGTCKLDREAILTQCENGGVLAVPDCAADAYLDLANTYSGLLLGVEFKCDAAHQAMVALAVAQTNHDVDDPILFFAMATVFFALNGVEWRVDTNWLKGSSPCSGWYGVECSDDGYPISISLQKNRLAGFLPTEIGLLSNLRDLDIGSNEVSGPLPSEIGLLTKLQTLLFHLTSIHSELPSEIGMMTELTEWRLSNTLLTGTIPTEIGNMIKLEDLEMESNLFTGTLPTEFGDLVQLQRLRLIGLHGITGTIPLELVTLTKLTHFDTVLPGVDPSPFPEVIALATNLELLDMRDASATGSLPTTIGHLSHLTSLKLLYMDLAGTIPTEVGLLSDLVSVEFRSLGIQGTVPSEFGQLSKLSDLVISEEPKMTGTLPSELGSLTALKLIEMRNTGLGGAIPSEVCALNIGFLNIDICKTSLVSQDCFSGSC